MTHGEQSRKEKCPQLCYLIFIINCSELNVKQYGDSAPLPQQVSFLHNTMSVWLVLCNSRTFKNNNWFPLEFRIMIRIVSFSSHVKAGHVQHYSKLLKLQQTSLTETPEFTWDFIQCRFCEISLHVVKIINTFTLLISQFKLLQFLIWRE